MTQQFRDGNGLRGHGLGQLRHVAAKGQGRQIVPETGEELQGGGVAAVVPVPALIKGPLGVGQGLGGGGKFAVFLPRSPGDDGNTALLPGQER